ncbi:DUF1826 domain-containing protein [Pseudoalteromonas ruthenica]|uniref:DUF1826 domain-containing protein n=1 Tax=Pseudoalteromonas ruthenica TaxID=151081 RepID=UPI0014863A18|nr:DUF1826 domain-containing protein [Pseudoalteromonas ruthenica]
MQVTPSHAPDAPPVHQPKTARASSNVDVLPSIYQPAHNIVIWKRALDSTIRGQIQTLIQAQPNLALTSTVSAKSVLHTLQSNFDNHQDYQALFSDISTLVDMFSCLLDCEHVGLRLKVISQAMCPRFHIDRVPVRLVTTYQGPGSQWLAHADADYSKLGSGNQGLSDEKSGLYRHAEHIHQLQAGDVALLKGQLWPDGEHSALVHRSPPQHDQQPRLLLTLDGIF